MSNVTITAASLLAADGALKRRRIAGEALAQGDAYYIDPSDRRAKKSRANGTVAQAAFDGIALAAVAAAEQPFEGIEGGDVDVGANLTVGVPYVISATAGKIAPLADLAQGNKITGVGYAVDTGTLRIAKCPTGAAVP